MGANIFVDSIDKIEFKDIDDFIKDKMREFIRLDYKRQYSDKDVNKQIAKEISAFANTQGGILLIGVDEHDRVPTMIVGIDKTDHEHKIKQIAFRSVYPPLIDIEVRAYDIPGKTNKQVVLIRILESEETPHHIEKRKEFYIRMDDISEPVQGTDEDYEWLRKKRARTLESRNALIQRARERTGIVDDVQKLSFIECIIAPCHPKGGLLDMAGLDKVHSSRELKYEPILAQRYRIAYQSMVWVGGLAYTEFNTFGMFYHKGKLGESITKDSSTGENLTRIAEELIVLKLLCSYGFAKKAIEVINYQGLLFIELNLTNIKGKFLGCLGVNPAIQYSTDNADFDDVVSYRKVVPIQAIVMDSEAIIGEFLSSYRMCFGEKAIRLFPADGREIVLNYRKYLSLD